MDPQTLLSDAKCFVCLGLSEGEALELALLNSIAAPIPALDLIQVVNDLVWTWNGSNPNHWNIEFSEDGVTNWIHIAVEPGASRSYVIGDTGEIFGRVWGANAGDVKITPFSNVIFII